MTARRLTMLAVTAGLLTLAACGEPTDDPAPAGAEPAEVNQDVRRGRTLDDVTSNLPAGWPATEAMRETEAFAPHGSPWYPTPAAATPEDACLNRDYEAGIPQPC